MHRLEERLGTRWQSAIFEGENMSLTRQTRPLLVDFSCISSDLWSCFRSQTLWVYKQVVEECLLPLLSIWMMQIGVLVGTVRSWFLAAGITNVDDVCGKMTWRWQLLSTGNKCIKVWKMGDFLDKDDSVWTSYIKHLAPCSTHGHPYRLGQWFLWLAGKYCQSIYQQNRVSRETNMTRQVHDEIIQLRSLHHQDHASAATSTDYLSPLRSELQFMFCVFFFAVVSLSALYWASYRMNELCWMQLTHAIMAKIVHDKFPLMWPINRPSLLPQYVPIAVFCSLLHMSSLPTAAW